MQQEKKQSRELAQQTAVTNARMQAELIERTIGHLDYIMQSLQFQWQENNGRLNLEKQKEAGLVPKAAQISVTLFGPDGRPVTTTSPQIKSTKGIATRDYFKSHAASPSTALVISKVMHSILVERDVILLSRRLNAPDGAFAGVMVVAIEPVFLAAFIDEADFGEGDFVSFRSADGDFLVSKTKKGIQYKVPNLLEKRPPEAPAGVRYRSADQYRDKKGRIVAWNTASSYPIMAVVGVAEASLLANYEPRRHELLGLAAAGTLILLGIAIVGTRHMLSKVSKAQYNREVNEAYRIATESAKEGFYMLRPLQGKNREITDFLIEDCNERGAIYKGLSREALVGRTVVEAISKTAQPRMMAYLHKALKTGFLEDEVQISQEGARAPQWLYLRIVRSSAGLAVTLRDITESKSHQEALVVMANADPVTSLPNRHWLMNHLPGAVDSARSTDMILAVLFVDLDDFKNINDTLGHAAGDELLKAAALRLKGVIRPQDRIARLGGDEFTIVVESAQTREEVLAVAERVIQALRSPFALANGERKHVLQASVGISLFPEHGSDPETLLRQADMAMYAAKDNGKGMYCLFEPNMERHLFMQLTRQAELKRGIGRGELVLHYQPRVRGDTGEITSMEALVRWNHPERGLIPPVEFIPMAEKAGLIVALGEEVIRMACMQLALWKEEGLDVVPVSVNVAAQQIDAGTVNAILDSALAGNGLDASLIEVEITESATIAEDGQAVAELEAIQKMGIKLYVDDFGTGYSCLAQLKRLDMDGLKVDRAFTSQMLNSPADAALFEAIVSMAHALDMRVVAEGVETAEQLAALQALSCDEVQGYYISRPVPAAQVRRLLEKRYLFPEAERVT
ncbi:bifunctional diguanylate cyclase/phosphodiesterase [Noviherbaspirillum soli]|uniref:bifunctional diguanylate cyclase/phosphodiesterase n=1 Tax=Noviherbaspirillum soli TaxID=1064518 RepID=UPI001889D7E1|nr:EAL domain-containing protein [Noviherbaspirillum soli]